MTYQLQTADVPHHQTTTDTITDAVAKALSGLLSYSSYAVTTEVAATEDVTEDATAVLVCSAAQTTDADVKLLSSSYSLAAVETALSATKYSLIKTSYLRAIIFNRPFAYISLSEILQEPH